LNGPGAGSGTPADYLHFATHALLDGRAPLDSALVLAPGDGEDGLLRAREVIEQLRVESDLVVLSACDTGLGAELAGEGVLGLSHAFLFSGARTIVTSLWPVADDSTARWMAAFYGELRRGADRDEAVRSAQVEALAGDGPRRHPYYWAAFQLWGDWGR
jgi:CHAT domain-containing protein